MPAAEVGRIAGERTARRLDGAPARHARMPGAVRGAGSGRPDRLASCTRCRAAACTASRRSCSTRSGSRCSRRTCRFARSRTFRARAAARRSTAKASPRCRATSCATACVQGYFLGSYSARKLGMAIDRQRRRRHNLVVAPGSDDLAGAARAHGPRPARHRAARAGREPGDRRLLARRRRLLGRGRRDRLSGRGDHDRRQPEATCSATSSPSATTSTGAARATSARFSSTA